MQQIKTEHYIIAGLLGAMAVEYFEHHKARKNWERVLKNRYGYDVPVKRVQIDPKYLK